MAKMYILRKVKSKEGNKYVVAKDGAVTDMTEEYVWAMHLGGMIDETYLKIYRNSENKVVVASKDLSRFRLETIEEGETKAIGLVGGMLWDEELLKHHIGFTKGYERRSEFEWVKKSVMSRDTRVTALIGLRRTGKTVLLLQIADEAMKSGIKVGFILAGSGCEIIDVDREAERAVKAGAKIIIIDEITWARGFLSFSRNLVNKYNNGNTRLIIAGTDSFQLITAKNDQLFGMVNVIETGPITFCKYREIKPKASVMDYLRNGGILQDINHNMSYEDYTKSAIVENIINTIRSMGEFGERYWKRLYDVYYKGRLEEIIKSIIIKNSKRKAFMALKGLFKDSNLAVALKMSNMDAELNEEKIEMPFDSARAEVGISKITENSSKNQESITEDDVGVVMDAMEIIKAISYTRVVTERSYKEEKASYEINAPQFGLRYHLAVKTIFGVYKAYLKLGLSAGETKRIEEAIQSNIEGIMLEDVVAYHLGLKYGRENVYKCRIKGDKEIDIVIDKPEGKVMVEIKRSDRIVVRKPDENGRRKDQIKWLVDEEVNDFISSCQNRKKIIKRMVLYNGKNTTLTKEQTYSKYEVSYVNIDEFMTKLGV
jgi:predicted AAA+ superfamily ATPase